ncbi:MAG: CDC27 family protein [Pseudomonadota bacterium]|nr:CDC27 family protein [Pseudomonadota bacterium]
MMRRLPVLVPLILLLSLLLGLLFGNPARADSPSLTARVYKVIVDAQTALQKKQLDSAQKMLEDNTGNRRNSPYDNAMLWHLLGYVYYEQGQLNKSADAFEKVFDYDIPVSLSNSNHKMLGQVYMARSQYREALPHLRRWLENETDNREEIHALIAHCYYEMKQYKSAVTHLETAIDGYQARRKTPRESWLNLLQASLAQMNDVEHRIRTIRMLLAWFPKKEYWLALASAYAQLEQMDKYLAILALAERKDLLNTDAQFVSLASVYFAEGAPQKAAQILEEGMQKGVVHRNIRNLRFLASAYSMAREYEKALVPLRAAAAQSKDGELDIMLGNALYQLARWEEASEALLSGLDKGDLRQSTTAWLMLGQSQINLKQYDAAIAAFEQAALDEERSQQAQQWIQYARYEKERQEKLKLEADPS